MTQGVEDMNHDQSTSSMATTRMETTHGLTYSVVRAIEVTAWQSVDTICHCCLTVPVLKSLDYNLFWLQQWRFHLSMPSSHDMWHVLDQPMCSMLYNTAELLHWAINSLTHRSCVVHVFVLFMSYSVAWSLSFILMTVMWMQCSMFCMCICSGSPYNVMHSSSNKLKLCTGNWGSGQVDALLQDCILAWKWPPFSFLVQVKGGSCCVIQCCWGLL